MTFGAAFAKAPRALKRAFLAWFLIALTMIVPVLVALASAAAGAIGGAEAAALAPFALLTVGVIALFGTLFYFTFHGSHPARVALVILNLLFLVLVGVSGLAMMLMRFGGLQVSLANVAPLIVPVLHAYVAWALTRPPVLEYTRPEPHKVHPHPVPERATLAATPLPESRPEMRACPACGARTPTARETCVECGNAV